MNDKLLPGLIIVSQTADTAAIPSEVRNNLDVHFCYEVRNEQASQLANV